MMKVVDIKACSELVHEHNKDIVVVVDNTFMSAYFQVSVSHIVSWSVNQLFILNASSVYISV